MAAEVFSTTLKRRPGEPLGLKLICNMNKVFVSGIDPGRAASATTLQVGDRIVEVNGFVAGPDLSQKLLQLKDVAELTFKYTRASTTEAPTPAGAQSAPLGTPAPTLPAGSSPATGDNTALAARAVANSSAPVVAKEGSNPDNSASGVALAGRQAESSAVPPPNADAAKQHTTAAQRESRAVSEQPQQQHHQVPPPAVSGRRVELCKDANGFGMVVKHDPVTGMVFIKEIAPGGAAEHTGALHAGDWILEIDDQNMRGAARAAMAEAMRGKTRLNLVVASRTEFNPPALTSGAPAFAASNSSASINSTESTQHSRSQRGSIDSIVSAASLLADLTLKHTPPAAAQPLSASLNASALQGGASGTLPAPSHQDSPQAEASAHAHAGVTAHQPPPPHHAQQPPPGPGSSALSAALEAAKATAASLLPQHGAAGAAGTHTDPSPLSSSLSSSSQSVPLQSLSVQASMQGSQGAGASAGPAAGASSHTAHAASVAAGGSDTSQPAHGAQGRSPRVPAFANDSTALATLIQRMRISTVRLSGPIAPGELTMLSSGDIVIGFSIDGLPASSLSTVTLAEALQHGTPSIAAFVTRMS